MPSNPFDEPAHASHGANPFNDAPRAGGGNPFDEAHAPARTSHLSHGGNPLAPIGAALGQGVRNVQSGMSWINQNPLAHGVMAALGTTGRLGSGAVSGAMQGGAKGAVMGAAHAAGDPEGETERLHGIERARDRGLMGLVDKVDSVIPGGNDWKNGPRPHEDPTAGGIANAADDFLTGSALDPTSYVPGADVVSMGARAAKLARVGEAAGHVGGAISRRVPTSLREAVASRANLAKNDLSTSAIPLQGVTQEGLNHLRAIEGGGKHLKHTLSQQLHAAHEPHADMLSSLSIVPPEMRRAMVPDSVDQALDRVAYLGGDKQTQTDALRAALAKPNGYRPTPEDQELAKNPLNIYTKYDPHYVPTQAVRDDLEIDGRPKVFRKSKGTSSSHNQAANKNITGHDFAKQVQQRLETAASDISRAHTQRTALETLGLSPAPDFAHVDEVLKAAAKAGDTAKVQRYTALKQRLYEKMMAQDAVRSRMIQPNADMEVKNVNSEYSGPTGSLADIQQRARNQLSARGVDTSAAFDKAGGVLENKALGPIRNRVNTNLAAAALISRVASKSRHAAQDVGKAAQAYGAAGQQRVTDAIGRTNERIGKAADAAKERMGRAAFGAENVANDAVDATRTAASKAALDRQKDVERAANALRTKLALRGGSTISKLLEARGDDTTSRVARVIAGLRDSQAEHGGEDYLGIKASGITPTTSGVVRPSERTAKRITGLTDSAVTGAFTKHINDAAESGKFTSPIAGASVARNTRSISNPAEKAAATAEMARRIQLRRLNSSAKQAMSARDRNAALKTLNERVQAIREREGNVNMPKVLSDRLFGEEVKPPPNILGQLGKDLATSLFWNPIPHSLGNIAQQQAFAGGGVGALAKGAKDAILGGPDVERGIEDAKKVGATSTHGYDNDEPLTTHHQRLYNALQKGMTRFHDTQAAELFRREKAKGLSDADAAEEVRKTFGRPYERSESAKAIGGVGGKLANFALATVPRSAKKMLGSPGGRNNLKQFARANEDVNDDFFEPQYGVEFNPGGFASRAASLAFRPASYFGSRSLQTSMGSELSDAQYGPEDLVKSVLPFGGLLDLAKQPLSEKQRATGGYDELPNWLKLLGLTGGYFTHAETSKHKARRNLVREGLQ